MTEQTNILKIIKSSRKRRIVAFLIDLYVFTFLAVSIAFLIIGPAFIDKTDNEQLIKKVMIIVMIPIFIIFFCKDFINGISLGRWIMGIMVRDESNSNEVPSKVTLLIRNLFQIIWPIEFLVLAFNKNKKRLGDYYGKTIVLKNSDKAKKSLRFIAFILICLVSFGFSTLFTLTSLKSSEAYKTAIHNIEKNYDILDETGGIKGYGSFPKGNINVTNGYGQAGLEIKVIGSKKDITVIVYLMKEPNEKWTVKSLRTKN